MCFSRTTRRDKFLGRIQPRLRVVSNFGDSGVRARKWAPAREETRYKERRRKLTKLETTRRLISALATFLA